MCPWAKHFTHITSYKCEWRSEGGWRGSLVHSGCQAFTKLPVAPHVADSVNVARTNDDFNVKALSVYFVFGKVKV